MQPIELTWKDDNGVEHTEDVDLIDADEELYTTCGISIGKSANDIVDNLVWFIDDEGIFVLRTDQVLRIVRKNDNE